MTPRGSKVIGVMTAGELRASDVYELAFVNRAPKVDLTPKIRLPRAPSGRGLRPNCVLVRVERGHGEVPCAHVHPAQMQAVSSPSFCRQQDQGCCLS